VLFLDDLQWCDPASLTVLTALIMDDEIEGLMILGACRGNEVSLGHHLLATLRELEANGLVVTNIVVSDLGPVAISKIFSDLLQLPKQITQSLAEFLCLQTDGNIFFVCQFLRAMSEEGF
jgi:predicted ATPase